jgi:hypothetical protein
LALESSSARRLRREDTVVELAVYKCSFAGYSPDSNDVSTEVEESLLLESVTRERLVKIQQAGKGYHVIMMSKVEIGFWLRVVDTSVSINPVANP